jgi:hypothetical protein
MRIKTLAAFGWARRADFVLADGVDHLNYCGVAVLAGGLWIRVSTRIYSEIGDRQRRAELRPILAAR